MDNVDKYQLQVFYSEEDREYVATVAEFPNLSALGPTVNAAIEEMQAVLKDVVEMAISEGEVLPEPNCDKAFKGNIALRLPPSTHRAVAIRSKEEGVSLNQYLTSVIEKNLYTNQMEKSIAQLSSILDDFRITLLQNQMQNLGGTIIAQKQRYTFIGTDVSPQSAIINRATGCMEDQLVDQVTDLISGIK